MSVSVCVANITADTDEQLACRIEERQTTDMPPTIAPDFAGDRHDLVLNGVGLLMSALIN